MWRGHDVVQLQLDAAHVNMLSTELNAFHL
jgi:hypothetical protein